MSEPNYTDADISLPEFDGRIFKGTIYQKGDHNYLILKERPYNEDPYKTIPIAFAKTSDGIFSCVQCSMFRSDNGKTQYLVTEFYDGELIEDSKLKIYSKLTAEVFYFNEWLKSKQIDFDFKQKDKIHSTFHVLDKKDYRFNLQNGFELLFEAATEVVMKRQEINLKNVSSLSIVGENPSGRSELFACFYSFLIFYTLFLKKIPSTSKLSYWIDEQPLKLLGLPKGAEESPFDILLDFTEIENFEKIVVRYYKSCESYNTIIQLLEKAVDITNPEVCFLHLTQAFELLHKAFFQDDKDELKQYAKEVYIIFQLKTQSKRWDQLMIYYFFYQIAEDQNLGIRFPSEYIAFIKKIRNTRNYYTHYDKAGEVWKYVELYSINGLLMIWLRALILYHLGLSIEKIRTCIKRETRNFRNDDIFENEFSMRYKNYFTK